MIKKGIKYLYNNNFGFTLIETLAVITSLILIMVSGSSLFFSSILGSAKVAALKEVRQNGQYALKIMEEMIKNSQGLVSCESGTFSLSNPETFPEVTVRDMDNNQTSFLVDNSDENHYKIASKSGSFTYYLTSNKVNVETFQIECGDAFNEISEGEPSPVLLKFKLSVGDVLNEPKFRTAQMTFDSNVTIRLPYKKTVPNN